MRHCSKIEERIEIQRVVGHIYCTRSFQYISFAAGQELFLLFRLIQNEERVVPSFKTTLTSNNERFNKIQDELLVGISLHQSNGYHEWVSLRILFFTGECLTLTADITFVVCVLGWIESLRNHMRLHAHSSWILSRMKPSLNITFVLVKRILHCQNYFSK